MTLGRTVSGSSPATYRRVRPKDTASPDGRTDAAGPPLARAYALGRAGRSDLEPTPPERRRAAIKAAEEREGRTGELRERRRRECGPGHCPTAEARLSRAPAPSDCVLTRYTGDTTVRDVGASGLRPRRGPARATRTLRFESKEAKAEKVGAGGEGARREGVTVVRPTQCRGVSRGPTPFPRLPSRDRWAPYTRLSAGSPHPSLAQEPRAGKDRAGDPTRRAPAGHRVRQRTVTCGGRGAFPFSSRLPPHHGNFPARGGRRTGGGRGGEGSDLADARRALRGVFPRTTAQGAREELR